jgi:hypothetical protein
MTATASPFGLGIGNTAPGALLDLGLAGTTLGVIRFEGSTSGYVGFQAPAAPTSVTYTLPTGAPGTSGYVLSSTTAGVMSWIASGSGSTSNVLVTLQNGSAAAPSLSFFTDTTTGIYNGGTAGVIDFTTAGVQRAQFDNAGNFDVTNGTNTSAGGYQINAVTVLALPDEDSTSIAVGQGALQSQNAINEYNTAVGQYALQYNTSGIGNVAVGPLALSTNVTGANNTAIGSTALSGCCGGASPSNSTAVGNNALQDVSSVGPNDALGVNAGAWITTGTDNVAIGYESMQGVSATPVTGQYNVAVGTAALTSIAGAASQNIAIGYNALNKNTTASYNQAFGYEALQADTTGANNIGIGSEALFSNQTANDNIAIGGGYNYSALQNLTSGNSNTAIGSGASSGNESAALGALTTGSNNVAIGDSALMLLASGSGSTAVGGQALLDATGSPNDALGYNAGEYITSGTNNVALGYEAMMGISATPLTGNDNTAVGNSALPLAQGAAANNTAMGYQALGSNTTGSNNTALGMQALWPNQTGSGNTAVGIQALSSWAPGPTNSTAVGDNALQYASAGSTNDALGYNAGSWIDGGSSNVAIGYEAMQGISGALLTGSYNTAVGNSALLVAQGAAANNTTVGYGAGQAVTTGTDNTLVGYYAGNAVTGSHNIVIGESTTITTGSSNIIIGNTSAKVTNTSSSQIDIGDHLLVTATDGNFALTNSSSVAINSCGSTGAGVTGNANAMQITQGSTTGTSCTITLGHAWTSTPICVASWATAASILNVGLAASVSSTTLTVTLGTTEASKVINVICIGYK